ncbi:helix-turn-helix domain-containing protein [Treponema sp.]|uniref:helix-turn-helix domain-containing protein n=1 Tax=Treponema sp. TaxID=166 RepID=UPI00388E1CC8
MLYNEALRSCRLDANMTQEQVAEALSVTKGAISQYENGVGSAPSISRLFQLADLYNVSLDKLLGRNK